MLIEPMARAYFRHFPIEKGKWWIWTRLAPALAKNASGEVEVTLRHGIRARLDLGEYIQRFVYYWGSWDPSEVWAIERLLRPGDTFIDAGANFGYFTLLASRIVGPAGRVFSFEPSPPTAAWLRANVALNEAANVTIDARALSDSAGTVRITRASAENSGVNSIRQIDQPLDAWQVPSVTLDDAIPASMPVRVLKMDIEGAEQVAIRGFESHLRDGRVDFVLCEVHDNYLRELGSSSEEFFGLLAGHAFRPYSFYRDRFTPIAGRRPRTPPERDQWNVLFARSGVALPGG